MEKIRIRDITEAGININDQVSQNLFELSDNDYLKLIEPVTVNARIQKFDQTILSTVDVKTRFAAKCYRSLENVQRDWTASFTLDYEIEPNQEELDIEDDIRQEVILRLPMRVLSDKEIEKERQGIPKEEADTDLPPENTYKPFANLKDLE